jgi:uncharacterized membrane-anchored protein
MPRRTILSVAIFLLLAASVSAQAPDSDSLQWQAGPSLGNIGGIASVRVPLGYVYLDGNNARKLLEKMENPTSGAECGMILSDSLGFFVVFEFDDVGYVRDDEKNSLDAAAMLESIKKGTEQSNEERRRRGWAEIKVLGWEQPPRYNEATHNLEWSIRGESKESVVINHFTRVLGRKGVMSAVLVCDPDQMAGLMPEFYSIMGSFGYNEGQRYAEVGPNDKIAKYGLTALVTGGAAAVAAKSGLFKWLWKLIVLAVVAIGGFLRKLFTGRASGE